MKTNHTTVGILALRASGYGAVEIKKNLKANTFRGFAITTTTIGLFLFLYWGMARQANEQLRAPIRGGGVIHIDDFEAEGKEGGDVLPPPITPPEIQSGPASRAGTPVPVPDADITPDMQDFADLKDLGRASSIGGDGLVDDGGLSSKINWGDEEKPAVNIQTREILPDDGVFIVTEKEPAVDLPKLQALIVYPQLAIKANVEGKVTLNVLVDSRGDVRNIKIISSDNILLNEAAIDAVKNYGKIPPALQNGQSIACWVAIPIVFRLK